MQGVSVGDGDTIDVTFGTQQNITDAGIGTVEDQQVSPVSSAMTIGSAAVDTQTYFQFFREASSGADTFTGESRVLGVKLFFTTDAANDA
jgi:phosphopentomutase